MDTKCLESVVEMLAWRKSNPLLTRSAREARMGNVRQTVTELLSSDQAEYNLRTVWTQLPSHIVDRIAGAPTTSYVIDQANRSATLRFIYHSIEAELNHACLRCGRPAVWTALGDIGWMEDGAPVVARRTMSGIPVDFDSPGVRIRLCIEDEGNWNESSDSLSVDSRNIAIEKIDSAMECLKSGSDYCYELVCENTRVITITCHPKSGLFSSASSPEFPGRTELLNPHLLTVDVADVVDSLLHEAIHALLYELERTYGSLTTSEATGTIRSPWSTRELDVHTFVHACFVWYGLFYFWGAMESLDQSPRRTVRRTLATEYKKNSQIGFVNGDPASMLTSSAVPCSVRDAVRTMQVNVRRSTNNG